MAISENVLRNGMSVKMHMFLQSNYLPGHTDLSINRHWYCQMSAKKNQSATPSAWFKGTRKECPSKTEPDNIKWRNLIHLLSEKQNLRTERLISPKYQIYRKLVIIFGFFLNDREVIRDCFIPTLENLAYFLESLNKQWPRTGRTGKGAELNFVCVTGLVLSAQQICEAGLHLFRLYQTLTELSPLYIPCL